MSAKSPRSASLGTALPADRVRQPFGLVLGLTFIRVEYAEMSGERSVFVLQVGSGGRDHGVRLLEMVDGPVLGVEGCCRGAEPEQQVFLSPSVGVCQLDERLHQWKDFPVRTIELKAGIELAQVQCSPADLLILVSTMLVSMAGIVERIRHGSPGPDASSSRTGNQAQLMARRQTLERADLRSRRCIDPGSSRGNYQTGRQPVTLMCRSAGILNV
jgi:hypothetical protein